MFELVGHTFALFYLFALSWSHSLTCSNRMLMDISDSCLSLLHLVNYDAFPADAWHMVMGGRV